MRTGQREDGRPRVGARMRRRRRAVLIGAFVAVAATVAVGSTGAYFTSASSLAGQVGTVAKYDAVEVTAAEAIPAVTDAVAGQSTDLSWTDAKTLSWAQQTPNAVVKYTVERNTRNDFSASSNAAEIYSGTSRTASDTVGAAAPVATRQLQAIAGTQRQDGFYGVIGGKVWLWGTIKQGEANSETYLGLPSSTPVAVTGIPDSVVQLVAGRDHGCALTVANRIYCFGFNASGQLGDGTTTARVEAKPIVDSNRVFADKVIRSVDAGEYFTCALATDGTVGCWGSNQYGQLGVPTSTTSSTVPVKVVDGANVFGTFKPVLLTTGAMHVCVVKGPNTDADGVVTRPGQNGMVACWGRNNWRQLGANRTSTADPGFPEPVDVKDTNNVFRDANQISAISAGHAVTCVLTNATSGTNVACWGGNGLGASGAPNTDLYPDPRLIVSSEGGFTAIDVGTTHTCATKGTAVSCWGQNTEGQLGRGLGNSTAVVLPAAPVSLTSQFGDDPIAQVAVSWTSTCVTSVRGGLSCWGNGGQREFPGSGTTSYSSPMLPKLDGISTNPPETTTAMATANDGFMTLAVINGVTSYWGRGLNGSANGYISQATSATAVSGVPANARLVTAGQDHGCAVVGDAQVWCFGSNAQQQLGTAAGSANSMTAVRVPDAGEVLKDKRIVAIDAGDFTTCVLASDGTIACWGDNGAKQISTRADATLPLTRFTDGSGAPYAALSGANAATAIATGSNYVCATRAAKPFVCWGSNDVGQFGNGNTTASSTPVENTSSVFASGLKTLDTSWKTTCALTTAGRPYCWGRNAWGEVGNGLRATSSSAPVAVTGNSIGSTNWSNISVGVRMGCVTAGAAGMCWGDNDYGELGIGADGAVETALTAQSITDTGGTFAGGVAAISAGWQHTCVLTTRGSMSCWGRNTSGQVGQGNTSTMYTVPTTALRNGKPLGGAGDRSCLDGAVMLNGWQCSLAPALSYFYRVGYTVDGVTAWSSAKRTALRGGYTSCADVFAANRAGPSAFEYALGEAGGTTRAADADGRSDRQGTFYGPMTAAPVTGGACGDGTAWTPGGSDASGGQYVVSAPLGQVGPTAWTATLWFQTSLPQGTLIGYGNGTSGLSSNYDRQVFIDSSGRLNFGVISDGGVMSTLRSTASAADGRWHHLASSYSSSDGMRLYLDGQLIERNTTSFATLGYTGQWRVGGDKNSGWPNAHTGWVNGSMRYAAVWNSVLPSDEIFAQYVAGRPS